MVRSNQRAVCSLADMDPRRGTDATARRRDALRRKYLNLGIGELAAATTFCLVAAFSVRPLLHGSATPAMWSALLPLLFVLVQAGVYWLLARDWVARSSMPARVATIYRTLRLIDAGMLTVGLGAVIAWWPSQSGAAILVATVWIFGLVEYINYFHVRLSYPVRRWFTTVRQCRTPQLVRDMRSAVRSAAAAKANPMVVA